VENKIKYNKIKYKSYVWFKRMWSLICKVIPIIIGATEIVTNVLRKNLGTVSEKHSIDSPQKTAVLGTSHQYGQYCSVKLENGAVGITVGSRKVSRRKGP
jgi:hypothetical protein